MVDMKCEGCVNAAENNLQTVNGVKSVEVDLSNQVVRILGSSPVKTMTDALEQTGRKARLIGQGMQEDFLVSAAVVEFKGPEIFGVVRLVQVSMELAGIEASFSGLSPGKHGWSINEFGDLTRGAASTGKVFNPSKEGTDKEPTGDMGTLDVDKNGEAFYTGVKQQLRVADLIGRSVAVYETEDKSDQGLTAAVIARSAGVGENYKKICACDGTTIWEAILMSTRHNLRNKDRISSNKTGALSFNYNGQCGSDVLVVEGMNQILKVQMLILAPTSDINLLALTQDYTTCQADACFRPYCICSMTLCFSLIYAHTQGMEPQDSSLKIARFADFGIGLTNLTDSWNMESNKLSGGEGSPPIGLGLELGRGSGPRPTGFTVFQLQELQLQSLIYKYMEAGLPVPHYLLLPIWKSVAGSLGGLHSSPYQLYSSFLGGGSLHLEYKNGLDPEPGRCRRTDGKKWRCSKEAVPDHKYCERHMHRGRQRSRKLVEASQATSTTKSASFSRTHTDTNLSISLQVDNSSSSGSNLSSSFVGFSPRSVVRGGNPKAEPSLQFQELL
ncbi:hypothetical protein CRYUN_Cryun07bG0162000 [Craigia yunnanensis]